MAKSRNRNKPIDWDALELEAFNLRFERMSPEEKVNRARELAAKFRKHNQPLPTEIKRLLRDRTTTRRTRAGSSISLLDQYLSNPSLLRKK